MTKTCLVTGGAGFIGCALSRLLVEKFDRYVVFDNLHPQVHADRRRPTDLHAGAKLFIGDVTVPADWDRLLSDLKPTTVVHLAAETGTGQSLTEASRHTFVNVVGTSQMLDAFARSAHSPEHIVLASSRAVYGEGVWRDTRSGVLVQPGQRSHRQLECHEWDFPGLSPLPSRAATTAAQPTSIYGATKLAQEHILRAWSLAYGVPCSVLRFQNIYGPGQSLINAYTGIVVLFFRIARSGRIIPVYEDGCVTRDFVYIDDAAQALALMTTSTPASSRILDIGSGQVTTLNQLAAHVAKLYGAPAPEVCGKFRDGDVRHASCEIRDAEEVLDWHPEWTLENGLGSLKRWVDDKL